MLCRPAHLCISPFAPFLGVCIKLSSPSVCCFVIYPYGFTLISLWTHWGQENCFIILVSSVVQLCPTLRPHGLQHTRLPCPSPPPELAHTHVHRVGDAIQPSHLLLPLLLLPSVFPSIRVFSIVSQFFASGGQSIRVSASTSVLPMNIQDWFPLDGLVGSPCCPRDSQVSSPNHSSKASILQHSAFFIVQLSHPYMTTGKIIALTRWILLAKECLFFNILSRLITAFLLRNKRLLISWLQSSSAVIFGAQENKVCHCFHCFPIYLPCSDGTRCHDLSFLSIEL